MIAHVRGRVAALALNSAVIEVGGLGHRVLCTPGTIAGLRIDAEAELATSLVVREDSLTLYGFADAQERDTFELLQTASGIGPKVAQAMLAVLSPDRLYEAICGADYPVLTSVPGIGRKGAERIVVELKDRIAPPSKVTGEPLAPVQPWRDQVVAALQGLGWSAKDSEKAVDAVAAAGAVEDPPDIPSILRAALRTLAHR